MLLFGSLEAHAETGTDGIVWAFNETSKEGYDALNLVEHGHILTVFNDNDASSVLWKGRVELDFKNRVERVEIPAGTYLKEFGMHNKMIFSAQRIWGNSVHGLPETCDEYLWLQMFLDEKPAILEI